MIRDLLKENGYKAGVEIELRIDENWQPVPDVIGATRIEQPYPTEPVEVVVEVLSLDDRMIRVIEKCRKYSEIGVQKVLIIDPEHRSGLEWKSAANQLVVVESVLLPNGLVLELTELWKRLDLELSRLQAVVIHSDPPKRSISEATYTIGPPVHPSCVSGTAASLLQSMPRILRIGLD